MIDEYNQFLSAVDDKYRLFVPDTTLLSRTPEVLDISKGIGSIPEGRVNICYDNKKYECFFVNRRSKYDYLYVFLNGALTGERPEFKRWSYYTVASGSILNIADPMYEDYPNLRLGWYYGDQAVNYRRKIVDVVKMIAKHLEIVDAKVVFFGSSGGGTAAIECASVYEGAVAIAINPQIVLREYYYAREFKEITKIDLGEADSFHRNDVRFYINKENISKQLLFFNIRSKEDMLQVENIVAPLKYRPQLGLNRIGSVFLWLYDADGEPYFSNHVTQDNIFIFEAIEFFLHYNQRLDEISIERYVCLINKIWKDYWDNQKYRFMRPNFEMHKRCIDEKREVCVWGAGGQLSRLSKCLLDINGKNNYKIKRIIDENLYGTYKELFGKTEISSPENINNWNNMFVIITTISGKESVENKLNEYGLTYNDDYIYWEDLYC